MGYQANPGAIVAIVSGLAILALGFIVLTSSWRAAQPRAQRGSALAFGTFLVAWGAQIAIANTSNLADTPATMVAWAHANAVAMMVLYLPLVAFLLLYPAPRAAARHAGTWIAAALPAVLLLLVYAQKPDIMVIGAAYAPEGWLYTQATPLFDVVSLFSVLAIFSVALFVFARQMLTTRDDAVLRQSTLLTGALLSYVSYKAVEVASYALPTWRALFADSVSLVTWAIWAFSIPSIVLVAGILVLVARTPQTPWRELLLLAGVVPALGAAGQTWLLDSGVVAVKTGGLWRLGSAAFMAYAVLRFRAFSPESPLVTLEERLWRALPFAAYLALSGAGMALVWSLKGGTLASQPALGAAASVGVVAAMLPSVRVTRQGVNRVLDRPTRQEVRDVRRLEVYGAALAAVGPNAETDPWLRKLRRQLGVTPAEHGLVAALAQSPRLLNQGRSRVLETGDVIGGRYRAAGQISEGGHCVIHKATDLQSGGTVVLKELRAQQRHDAGMRIRLAREIAALEGLDDPNVVRLLGVVDEGGCPILVLEYLTGGSLAKVMAQGPVPDGTAAAIGCDILAGLSRLHERGIVHRDIKPANILMNASGGAKVADLGIARLAGDDTAGLTQVGVQPGTLAYMSPEQARGERVDARSDIYSVGIVLYELVAGAPAVALQGKSDSQIRRHLQTTRPRFPVPGASEELTRVLEVALAFEPEHRFDSAAAFHQALLPLRKSPGKSRRPPGGTTGAQTLAPTELAK